MKQRRYVFPLIIVMILVLANGICYADPKRGGRSYEVTITNLTRGQIFSPPIVISHDRNFHLFTLGAPAGPQLYPLAEDGDTALLIDHIGDLASVFDYAVAEGAVEPGKSITLEIDTRGGFKFLSAAGMLVTTNDAFFAVRNVRVPAWGHAAVDAQAYDAGSEANSEDCAFIPGPPCGNGGIRDTVDAEGYVHIHAGIHGGANLTPAEHDWRNPVAEITIRPKQE